MEKVCKNCKHWKRVEGIRNAYGSAMGTCKALNGALTPEVRLSGEEEDSTPIHCEDFMYDKLQSSIVFDILNILLVGYPYKFKKDHKVIIAREVEIDNCKEFVLSEATRVYCDDGTKRFDLISSNLTVEDLIKEALSLTITEIENLSWKVINSDSDLSYSTRSDSILQIMLDEEFKHYDTNMGKGNNE